MEMIVFIGILFIGLLLMPIIIALLTYKHNKGVVLNINQDRIRDPRYFGKSFSKMVEVSLSNREEDGSIQLSQREKTQEGTHLSLHNRVEEVVISEQEDFEPQAGLTFNKEIYAGGNALFKGIKEIRAVFCKKDMIIGDGTKIQRWADAEGTLAVYDDCDLGISASSGTKMSIGYLCRFKRLFAPEIFIGQTPSTVVDPLLKKDKRIYRLEVQTNKERNIQYISDDRINEEGIVDFSVITKNNVKVTENIIVQGDIRSHGVVNICDNAVVCGNIFAEKNIILGRNAVVLGNVFSQEDILVEDQGVIGQAGRISSVIARGNISFTGQCYVYGYISSEKGGRTNPVPSNKDLQQKPDHLHLPYLKKSPELETLVFSDQDDFNKVDREGYRHHPFLRELNVPQGVTRIKSSMFYQCRVLARISLPETLETIGDYAFNGCISLKSLPFEPLQKLESIGLAAFENCTGLEEICIPSSVVYLGKAAFAGCKNIRKVTFQEPSSLQRIDSHAFMGCENLVDIQLPSSVKEVGLSAFLGCNQIMAVTKIDE